MHLWYLLIPKGGVWNAIFACLRLTGAAVRADHRKHLLALSVWHCYGAEDHAVMRAPQMDILPDY